MATPPDFSPGQVLTAAHMDAVGLWLVKTQTVGTGVSSVTVTGAFSDQFDNYLVTIAGGALSTTGVFTMQLGSTTTGYKYSLTYTIYGGATLNVSSANYPYIPYVGIGTVDGLAGSCEVLSPNLAKNTYVRAPWSSAVEGGFMGGTIQNTTQYTAFTLGISAGTMTGGTIRVYGYRN